MNKPTVLDAGGLEAENRELKKRCSNYSQIIDNAADMTSFHDPGGTYLFVTPVCRDLIGYHPEELTGKRIYDLLHPDDLEAVRSGYEKMATQHTVHCLSCRLKHKDGPFIWVETSCRAIRDESTNEIEKIIVTTRDITERKNFEHQVYQHLKMKTVGTFAGGIGHSFNNILYIIMGNAELAMEDLPRWNPVRNLIQEIQSAGLRASRVVNQLLEFAQHTEVELSPVDMTALIKDTIKKIGVFTPSHIKVESHFQNDKHMVLADKTRAQQCLTNICANAVQAMEETGGRLTISVENACLPEPVAQRSIELYQRECLKISIQDTGPGIDPEIMDRIFDPYFTGKQAGESAGMGLAIAQSIVEKHGGKILLDSVDGEGAKFSVFLPLYVERPDNNC